MFYKFSDWVQGRNHPPPRLPDQPVPNQPPRGNKKLQDIIQDINQLRTGLDTLSADLRLKLADSEKHSRGFTEHVYQELDKRCSDVERGRQRIDYTIKTISDDLDKHKSVITETIKKFDRDLSAVEKFAAGEKFSPSFLANLMPLIEERLQPQTSPPSPSRLSSIPPPSQMDNHTKFSPTKHVKHHVLSPPPQRNYVPRANIQPPKFNPDHNTADFFLEELNEYFEYSGVAPEDRLCHLISVFSKEKELNLWWQRTKLQVSNWDEFCDHFMKMYGSTSDYTASLEKLLRRRQQQNESFRTFALEMELAYRKLHRDNNPEINKTIIDFISERALPSLKPHLLGCHAQDIYELIQFAQKLEHTVTTTSNVYRQGQKGVYEKNKSTYYNSQTRPSSPDKNYSVKKEEDKEGDKRMKTTSFTSRTTCETCGKYHAGECFMKKKNLHRVNTADVHQEPDVNEEEKQASGNEEESFMGSFILHNQIGNNSNSLPMIPVNLIATDKISKKKQKVTGKCLIDTGASVSVIGDPRLWANVPIKPWKKGPIKMVDGSLASPEGKMNYKFRLGNKSFNHTFIIMKECDFTMLLGMDFLRNSGMVLDLAVMQFWFKNTGEQERWQFDVTSAATTNVRALQVLREWEKAQIMEILKKYPSVVDSKRLGQTDVLHHEINVTEDKPKHQKQFPMSEEKHKIIDKIVEDMLKRGLISESTSPYSSPVIIRPKPNGDHRLVNDFRYVNTLTEPDGFPMRKIQDVFRLLSEATHLSTIDLEKGFWQVPLRERDKKFSAFRTRKGHYHYNVMPQGMKNSPATFQRLMNKVLKGMDAYVFVYQDDILIFSKSFDEHVMHINNVLERLRKANLTIQSQKCQFGRDKVKFLGHIISSNGIERNPDKVAAILNIPPPTNRKQLRKFLGAVGWFRHFLREMAIIAQPLYELLTPKKKYKWTDAAQTAFIKLKEVVSEEVILHHPNFNKPFLVRTDAANTGVGAVLLQEDDNNTERPVCFASKTLNSAQQNYSAVEKECYAIIFALEKFAEYLDGTTFSIQTDNQAVTYLNKMKNTNSRLMRWAWKIQEWCPSITHIKGRDNVIADLLSRNPLEPELEEDRISALTLTCNLDKSTLKKEQKKDPACRQQLLANPDQFCEVGEIIYKKLKNDKLVPYIPKTLRSTILHSLHDAPHAGHLGVDKTFKKLKSCAFFKGMKPFVKEYIKTCDLCQRNKYDNKSAAGLMGIKPITDSWKTVYVDLMGPYITSHPNRYAYLLVAVDSFSKFVELHPLRESTSKCIGEVMEKQLFCRYGSPQRIVTDNATSFKCGLMEQLCKAWGVSHSFSSAYHPQTNLSERVNRVIKPMIRTYLDGKPHTKWPDQIPFLQLAINTSHHNSTGFSPAKILFNTEPRLPIQNAIDATEDEDVGETLINDSDESNIYLSRFAEFEAIREQVKVNLEAAQQQQKINYDKHHRDDQLTLGDKVVIRNTILSNKDKKISAGLCSLFKSGPATVSKIISNSTYEVTFADGNTKGPIHLQMLRRYHEREDESTQVSHSPLISSPEPPEEPQPSTSRALRPRKNVDYRALHHGTSHRH